jgi:hypothetical protein
MRTVYIIVMGMLLASCAAPCSELKQQYRCPPDLGTTWYTVDANGCGKVICSVGGRGGYVDAPHSEVRP